MKIAILGFGDQGRSAYDYWNTPDNQVTICDSREDLEIPGTNVQLGPGYLKDLNRFDLIVRGAPSIHPRDIVVDNDPAIAGKITTVTNEFFRVCPTKNIIGVTGTKGKGTTSSLITKMLEASDLRVHLGGNIGIPPLDMLKNNIRPEDWVVLELANFQLIDIKYSPHIAVCLMVVAEHMDWHVDMDEYIRAKSQLFAYQNSTDIAIYFAENKYSKQIASAGKAQKIPYFAAPGAVVDNGIIQIDHKNICKTSDLKLLGKHNWQNACAAVTAAWQVTKDKSAINSALTSFSGLEHRLELVRELGGVKYYDDSFGTTPETAIVALEAFAQPKIVILGGSDKGASYGQLAQIVQDNNVVEVVLIGLVGPKIRTALKAAGYNNIVDGGKTMPDIVTAARAHAKPGSIVLLSTASASFDMFKNYKDRGEQFKQAVLALSASG